MMAEAQGRTLWDVLGQVPHQRSARGRRFGLQSVLAVVLALAALRNAALTVLRRLGFTNIGAGLEHCAESRQQLIHLVRYGRLE